MGFGTSPFGASPYGSASTSAEASFTVTYVEAIAKDIIRLHLSEEAVVNSAYKLVSNYQVEDSNSNILEIRKVMHPKTDTATYVQLHIRPQTEGIEYQVSATGINSRQGYLINNPVALWTYFRTKVDSIVSSIPQVYDTRAGSNIRAFLTAMAMSDNAIGGTTYGEDEDD